MSYIQKSITLTEFKNTLQITLEEILFESTIDIIAKRILKQEALQHSILETEIDESASQNISQLLSNQSSVTITAGNSISLQGLDPEYTQILLDGEPIIDGDEQGVDLSLLNINHLKRIEILQGASSFLYGSGALAGVVNLVTKDAQSLPRFSVHPFIGDQSNGIDIQTSLSVGKLSMQLLADYDDGKRATDLSSFYKVNFQPKFQYNIDESNLLQLRFQFQKQEVESINFLTTSLLTDERYTNHIKFEHYINSTDYLKFKLNYSRLQSTDIIFNGDNIQTQFKSDLLYDSQLGEFNLISGIGLVDDQFKGPIYSEINSDLINYYFFTATEYNLFNNSEHALSYVAGIRLDKHKFYQANWSPKLALSYSYRNKLDIKAEIGSAYKAPSFTELFLNFNGGSYFVIGANQIQSYLDQLNQSNQLQTIYFNQGNKINSETSLSQLISVKFNLSSNDFLYGSYSLNRLRNYIELIPFALNKHGYRIYSYRNISELKTETAELGFKTQLVKSLSIKAAYNFKLAKDQDILARIRQGLILNNTGRSVTEDEYGGLFNRSLHTVKLTSNLQTSYGIQVYLSAQYHSPFGNIEKESDGNQILNLKSEYDPEFVLIDFALQYRLNSHMKAHINIDNLSDYQSDAQQKYGRNYRMGIYFNFK